MILSACASNTAKYSKSPKYSVVTQNYEAYESAGDNATKIKLLKRRLELTCPFPDYRTECTNATAFLAGIGLLTGQYPEALEYSERVMEDVKKEPKSVLTEFFKNCYSIWNAFESIENFKIGEPPKTYMMVHYLILKNLKDPRAVEYLDNAYLCEMTVKASPNGELEKKYQEDSMLLHDKTHQQYVQLFIKEIQMPFKKFNEYWAKTYSKERYPLLAAKSYIFHKNALDHAKKIGLPQIFQDYTYYYVHIYERDRD